MNVEDDSTTRAGNRTHRLEERRGAHGLAGNGEQVTCDDSKAFGVPNGEEGRQRDLPRTLGGYASSAPDAPIGNARRPGRQGLTMLIEVIMRMRQSRSTDGRQ